MATPHRRTWLWFFLVLGILAVAAMSVSWVYHVGQMLTLEKLEHNRALWEAHRPRDYVLEYLKNTSGGDTEATHERFIVTVRGGRVQSVVMREENTTPPYESSLRADQFGEYDMAGMFDWMERFLEEDAKVQSRGYNRAVFEPETGRLIQYVHSKGASKRQVEIRVTRFEPGPQ